MSQGPQYDPLTLLGPAFYPRMHGSTPAAPVRDQLKAAQRSRRNKLWELSPTLHCSIIGTCLSPGDLRKALGKLGLGVSGASDHQLHGEGVRLAGQHRRASKLLNRLLDERHRLAIRQFERAASADELRSLWSNARERGDISSAYWAVLTHPAANEKLIKEIFGEVHMLSHLAGAAYRADIQRLSILEAEKAKLEATVLRQQNQLREAVQSRDTKIREMAGLLEQSLLRQANGLAGSPINDSERMNLIQLTGDLERRLGDEAHRSRLLEGRLRACRSDLSRERDLRAAAEHREVLLREELEALEANTSCAVAAEFAGRLAEVPQQLDGTAILYVGGRPDQIMRLRGFAARLGADFLHHDGGIEQRMGLLPGLIARADAVLFPVDCVSHAASSTVKQLCRQAEKPYLPLRSSGVGSFLAAVQRLGSSARTRASVSG